MSDPHHSTWIERFYRRWGSLLRAGAVVIAAIWTLFQFYSSGHDGKVRAALEYRKQVRAPPLFAAWQRTTIDNLEPSDEKSAALANEVSWHQYVMNLASEPENRKSLDTILSFYDEVWQCADTDICNRGTVLVLFGHESQLIYDTFIEYIACKRLPQNDAEYGHGLTELFGAYFQQTQHRAPNAYSPGADCDVRKRAERA